MEDKMSINTDKLLSAITANSSKIKSITDKQRHDYDDYLVQHISNVQLGYEWLKKHLPGIITESNGEKDKYGELDDIIANHDKSKYHEPQVGYIDEYAPYANYFYGDKKAKGVQDAFDTAWLEHIHRNPHHWQHWILQTDDEGVKYMDMPNVYIVEMICDWWAFSWKSGNLYEIFNWYNSHKDGIKVSGITRIVINQYLYELKTKLGELGYKNA